MGYTKGDWKKIYQDKVIDPAEAVKFIHSGETLFFGSCCGEPQTLVEALLERAQRDKLQNIKIVNISPPKGTSPYAHGERSEHFKVRTFFGNPSMKEAIKEGIADYIPCHLSNIPSLFYDNSLPLDVAMIQLSPPDEYGYCSLGISVDCAKAAIEKAKSVIAEVNTEMPKTLGNSFVHVSQIDHVIESSRPLITVDFGESPTEIEKAIGCHVANLIPDGATLALGFGKIVDAVLYGLANKKDLGIHTGTISDGIVKLVEMRVVTNKRKTIDQDKIISTMAMGTERLYRFCHNNPMVEMHPIEYTHNITTLAQIRDLFSINSAYEVDLYGQVSAEMMSDYHIGGTGGQVDFVRGAKRSTGGGSIICLQSTAEGKTVSRIVPHFKPLTPITTLRADIDYVVTEFGIARLKGQSVRERALALVNIAHPDFRKYLLDEFVKNWPMRNITS